MSFNWVVWSYPDECGFGGWVIPRLVWIGWLGHTQMSVDWLVGSYPDEC